MTDLNKGFKTSLLPSDVPFSDDQKQWLGGFLAGLHSRLHMTQDVAGAVVEAQGTPVATKPITILYGSQTGNAETCAYEAADAAQALGMSPVVMDMDDADISDLAQVERILICTSTYGEGEMPDNAQALWDAASADDAPSFI